MLECLLFATTSEMPCLAGLRPFYSSPPRRRFSNYASAKISHRFQYSEEEERQAQAF